MAAFAVGAGEMTHAQLPGLKVHGEMGFGLSKDSIDVEEEPTVAHGSMVTHAEPAAQAGMDDKTIVLSTLPDVNVVQGGLFMPPALAKSSSVSSGVGSMQSSLSADLEGSVDSTNSLPGSLASFMNMGRRECVNKCGLACGAAVLPLGDPGTAFDATYEYAPKRLAVKIMGMLADLGARWIGGDYGSPHTYTVNSTAGAISFSVQVFVDPTRTPHCMFASSLVLRMAPVGLSASSPVARGIFEEQVFKRITTSMDWVVRTEPPSAGDLFAA